MASILLVGSAGLLLHQGGERDREGRRKRKPSKLWMEVKDGKKPEELLCIKGAEKEDEERKIEEAEGYATQGAQKEILYCTRKS